MGAYVVTGGGNYNKPLELDNMQANEDGSADCSFCHDPEGSTTGADTFLGNKNVRDLNFLVKFDQVGLYRGAQSEKCQKVPILQNFLVKE